MAVTCASCCDTLPLFGAWKPVAGLRDNQKHT
jgi:hypothetical protein